MIAQNVTLSNKQEGKIQKWTKILVLVGANRPFRNCLQLAPVPERLIFVDSSLIPRLKWQRERTLGTRLKLTTPENTITYHNVPCFSPQNFA